MQKVLIPLLLCFALACHREPEFQKIKTGMNRTDVVQILGRPDSRKTMPDAEWWLYNDPGKHMLIIQNDTVVRCMTQEEAMKVMEETLKQFDSLKIK